MLEAMPWATWGGIKASAAGPGALMTCVTIRGPVRMKMMVRLLKLVQILRKWVQEKYLFRTMGASIGAVYQGAGR